MLVPTRLEVDEIVTDRGNRDDVLTGIAARVEARLVSINSDI